MNKTLLMTVSVVALVAAGGVAFAQGMNEPRDKPAAAAPAQSGKSDKMKVETPSKTEAVKPAPSAQLPAKPTGANKAETSGQGSTVQHDATTPSKSEAVKPNAQAPAKPVGAKSENSKSENSKTETSGQGSAMQPAQRNATTPNDAFAKGDAKQAAPAALSTEHHAKFRETVRGEKVAPFTGPKFSITVGEIVPQTVHLNRLPVRVYEYAPQYRGYEYILVGDDILIIDPRTHRIVAVIAA